MPLVEAAIRKLIALGGSSVPSAPCHLSRARPWARQANANGKQQQRLRARLACASVGKCKLDGRT